MLLAAAGQMTSGHALSGFGLGAQGVPTGQTHSSGLPLGGNLATSLNLLNSLFPVRCLFLRFIFDVAS
jgi:hypothetical protein